MDTLGVKCCSTYAPSDCRNTSCTNGWSGESDHIGMVLVVEQSQLATHGFFDVVFLDWTPKGASGTKGSWGWLRSTPVDGSAGVTPTQLTFAAGVTVSVVTVGCLDTITVLMLTVANCRPLYGAAYDHLNTRDASGTDCLPKAIPGVTGCASSTTDVAPFGTVCALDCLFGATKTPLHDTFTLVLLMSTTV